MGKSVIMRVKGGALSKYFGRLWFKGRRCKLVVDGSVGSQSVVPGSRFPRGIRAAVSLCGKIEPVQMNIFLVL
jgi:hypothetical protein